LYVRHEELLSGQSVLLPVEEPAVVEHHTQRITAQLVVWGQLAAERCGTGT
jgi:hypothetical protein